MDNNFFIIKVNKRLLKIFLLVIFIFSIALLPPSASASKTKVSATVAGWYEVQQLNNERLEIITNMKTIVNTKQCN